MSDHTEIIATAKRVLELDDLLDTAPKDRTRDAVIRFEEFRTASFFSAPQLAEAVIEMAEENDNLRVLKSYARHDYSCSTAQPGGYTEPCTCGLDDALATKEANDA